jgi:hypothetical protein
MTEKYIYILASDFSDEFKDFCATTTNQEVKECLEFFNKKSKKENEELLGKIGRNLMSYNKEQLTKHYEDKTVEWDNWVGDLVLFYCCRFVLYNKPIPILKKP